MELDENSSRFNQYSSAGVVGRRWRNLSFLRRCFFVFITFVEFLLSFDNLTCVLLLACRFLISFWFTCAIRFTNSLTSRPVLLRWFSFLSNKSLSLFSGASLGFILMWADEGRKIVLTLDFGAIFAARLSFISTEREE